MWREISGIFCQVFPVLVAVVVIRLAYASYWTGRPLRACGSKGVGTLIVLDSGGHTAEMLSIVNVLQKDKFVPRYYVAAATDNMSLQKTRILEESLDQQWENSRRNMIEAAQFMQIYRSCEVGQSYITFHWDNFNCHGACTVANMKN